MTTKCLIVFIAVLAWACPSARAMEEAARERLFIEAGQAYDQGLFDEAAERYHQLLKAGSINRETLFNFGNALFRMGRTAEAILFYRKAWHWAPHDPDIEANLRFAIEEAGATPPSAEPWRSIFTLASMKQWAVTFIACLWVLTVIAAFHLFSRRPLRLRWAVWTAGTLAVWAAGGYVCWYSISKKPEAVITEGPATARYAPLPDSTEYFILAEGQIVNVVQEQSGWSRVRIEGKDGWVPATATAPVFPLGDVTLPSTE